MEFRIADTFTDSLGRLTGDEQKAVKTTAFDLQINPASPGMSFHKLDQAKDKSFWSVRVNSDVVHKTSGSLLLCYVDHHDKAYAWAERRKLETHPKTGAAQFVEIRETVKEIVRPVYVPQELPGVASALGGVAGYMLPRLLARPKAPKPLLFADRSDDELLSYGVPPEWLGDVRRADEDSLLMLADHLPGEAADALLELATGGRPSVPPTMAPGSNPFDHPDAQRRFRVMANFEELQRALDFPWEKWTIFLHPEQREFVERNYNGPARVSGSAGTGKTIVALHRAVHITRTHPNARVLLTTFSIPLAHALQIKLRRLIGNEPHLAERIDVHSLTAFGLRLYKAHCGPVKLATRDELREILRTASAAVTSHKFSLYFLLTEWEQIVDAWQLDSWEAYRDVARLGRKTRLPEAQRAILWSIFERTRAALHERNLTTEAVIFTTLASESAGTRNPPYDFAVVDEAQDISIS
ncbi:MAG TPA: UvrD-helicase domain-containing protein [Chthoniobacterales bacterium]